jgi:hypothetical protein
MYGILEEEALLNTLNATQKSVRSTGTNRTRQPSVALSLSGRQKSFVNATASSQRKREQQQENLQNAITELLNHFSHRNLDAIVRVIRITLEKLRKRITLTINPGIKFLFYNFE